MTAFDSHRRRPDPLITPHKPAPRARAADGAPRGDASPPPRHAGGPPRFPRFPRLRRFRRGRGRFRWKAGWRVRLSVLVVLLLLAVLAFRQIDAGDRASLPSVRKTGPVELPPPQSFPLQDTVRTREGRWLTRYAADELLQERAERYVNRYRPEGAVVVVCDLRTGQIRALVERDSNQTTSRPRLALGTTFPAASLAKIVTAAAVLEDGIARPQDDLPLLGGAHTLYRAQLRVPSHGRYHTVTLREAFARSINPTFGILGLRAGPQSLGEMAQRLGFISERDLMALPGDPDAALPADIDPNLLHAQARLTPPDTGDFALAEVASGFTTATTISPLHALRIARAIGTDGRLRPVTFTRELQSLDNGRTLPLPQEEPEPFASPSTLQHLRTLMQATVSSGTARRGFRRNMNADDFARLDMGGKTGSLTGHNPPGRYEWYIGYARRKDHPDQGIAVAVMMINRTYLAVHATELAGLIIRDWSRYSPPYPNEDGRYLAGR